MLRGRQRVEGLALRSFIVRNLLKNRDFVENASLALVLPFVAGAVNASGFFIVGVYTSHITGSVARVGDEAAQGHTLAAFQAALLVVSFYLGATLATALVLRARSQNRARYVTAMLAQAIMLLGVTLLGIAQPKGIPFLRELTTVLLCVAMGAQNALVTKLSGAIVRTTHLTGIVTDLGIETVRAWHWLRERSGGSLLRLLALAVRARDVTDLKRLRLHGAIFFSFLAGAVVGPVLYLRIGFASMLIPVMVLLGLVYFDSVIGLRSGAEAKEPHDAATTPAQAAPPAPPPPPN
jgi:uncharacterized membrane protein YoaK (UPF0700 family)